MLLNRISALPLISIVLILQLTLVGHAEQKNKQAPAKKKRKPNSALAPITDEPGLPRVLLIGDSISIGYTVPARNLLKGKVNLHRIPANGGPTTRGLQSIDAWIGESKWDVIHFNWGIHDLKFVDGRHQVSLKDYEANLGKLVARLRRTGAKLIWCSTTPVPESVTPPRTNADVIKYNNAALAIMKANGIVVDDLYAFAEKQLDTIQRPKNVHFSPEGSKVLAGQVVKSISAAIGASVQSP